MTIFKTYISNLSPLWTIKRQEAILEGIEGTRFCDELESSERRGFRLNGLPDRESMLRKTNRSESQVIQVASIAVLARNAEDLMFVLAEASERNATIRDLSAKIDIKPNAKAKDLKAAAVVFAGARKRAAEKVRGQTGGQISGNLKSKLAKATALKFEADWEDFKKTNKQIVKESDLSVNTLKLYLGLRAAARAQYLAKMKRGTHMPRNPQEPTDAENAFVYLMRRDDGVYKVGVSSDPLKRAKDLRGEFKTKFKVVKTWQRRDAYRVEKFAHRLLKTRLHLGDDGWEAFKAPRKVVIGAIEQAIKQSEEKK